MVVGARWWWVVMVAMVVVGGDGGHGGEFGWDANELIASELLPVGRIIYIYIWSHRLYRPRSCHTI